MYPLRMCVRVMRTQPMKEFISTALMPVFLMPCSRVTQQPWVAVEPWFLSSSGHLLHFPDLWIFHFLWLWSMDEGRVFFPETTAKKSLVVIPFSVMNQVHLYFNKAFLWGGWTEFPWRKGQLLSWKGCSVTTTHFGKDTVTYVLFAQIFTIVAFGASTAWNPNFLLLPGMLF